MNWRCATANQKKCFYSPFSSFLLLPSCFLQFRGCNMSQLGVFIFNKNSFKKISECDQGKLSSLRCIFYVLRHQCSLNFTTKAIILETQNVCTLCNSFGFLLLIFIQLLTNQYICLFKRSYNCCKISQSEDTQPYPTWMLNCNVYELQS